MHKYELFQLNTVTIVSGEYIRSNQIELTISIVSFHYKNGHFIWFSLTQKINKTLHMHVYPNRNVNVSFLNDCQIRIFKLLKFYVLKNIYINKQLKNKKHGKRV